MAGDGWYARTLDLPYGPGTLRLDLADAGCATSGQTAFVPLRLRLHDLRDTTAAVERARRLLDADCDPVAVEDHFAGDPVLGPLVRATPGLRVPGQVDGEETADPDRHRPAGERGRRPHRHRPAGRAARPPGRHRPGRADPPLPVGGAAGGHRPDDAADAAPRGRALVALAGALADGDVALDRGPDRDQVRRDLLALPGIGPWTADYVAMRALAHPDVFLPTDVGVRNAVRGLGHDLDDVLRRGTAGRRGGPTP